MGGTPDLPPSIAWPHRQGFALSFVAQIRLADVASLDLQRRLPASGMLYFFLLDHIPGVQEPDGAPFGTSVVIHHDGPLDDLASVAFPATLPALTRFRPCRLAFTSEPTLPPPESIFMEGVPLEKDQRSRYWNDVWLSLLGTGRGHRLLGYADAAVKHDMQPADAELLLQLDSDATARIFFGESKVFFFIPKPSLDARRFEEARSVFDVG